MQDDIRDLEKQIQEVISRHPCVRDHRRYTERDSMEVVTTALELVASGYEMRLEELDVEGLD